MQIDNNMKIDNNEKVLILDKNMEDINEKLKFINENIISIKKLEFNNIIGNNLNNDFYNKYYNKYDENFIIKDFINDSIFSLSFKFDGRFFYYKFINLNDNNNNIYKIYSEILKLYF